MKLLEATFASSNSCQSTDNSNKMTLLLLQESVPDAGAIKWQQSRVFGIMPLGGTPMVVSRTLEAQLKEATHAWKKESWPA
jgi:hypothetical protein